MGKQCFNCSKKIKMMESKATSRDKNNFCFNCLRILFPKENKVSTSKIVYWVQRYNADYIKEQISKGFQQSIIDEALNITFKDNWNDINDAVNEKWGIADSTNQKQQKLDKILQQMKDAGVSDTFGTKKEIKSLPDILDDNEVVKYATSGFWNNNTVLMVCTDQRIIFLNKNMIYGTDRNDIPLNTVNAVSYSSKMIFATITITNGANTTVIEQVSKETADPMVKAIKKAQQNYINKQNVSVQPLNEADQIRKFKSLLDDGIITEEEFKAKKKQLLGL